jgi:hypothetical protein
MIGKFGMVHDLPVYPEGLEQGQVKVARDELNPGAM